MRSKSITKEQIIEAAAKVFSRRGLENATVDDIAKEAGIAKGSIYLYFPSKGKILVEGIKHVAGQRIKTLQSLLTKFPTAKERLVALFKANAKVARSNPEMFLMNYALLLSTHRNIKKWGAREFFKAYLNLCEEIIKEGIKAHEFRRIDPRLLALSMILTQDIGSILSSMDKEIINTQKIQKELIKLVSLG